jgi:hypothetical protein
MKEKRHACGVLVEIPEEAEDTRIYGRTRMMIK